MSSFFSLGVRYMLLASFSFSFMSLCVRLLSHLPVGEIIFFRALLTLFFSYAQLRLAKVSIFGKSHKLLIMRGLFGFLAIATHFVVIHHIPLATANVLHYLAPIFTTLVTFFLLGEPMRLIQWLFFMMSFGGIVLIKGFDVRIPMLDLVLGVLSSVFSAGAYTSIKKIGNQEHPLTIVFYFPLVSLPFAMVALPFGWQTPQGWDWLILLVLGASTQLGQVFMTKSYLAEPASKVSIFSYFGIIYSLGYGFFFFGETFDWLVFVGMAMVLGGVMLNASFHHFFIRKDK